MPCATSKRIGRCRLSPGGKQSISSPFCSASDSPPPSAEIFNRPQHTKFLTRPKFDPRFSASPLLRFSASPLLRFSASPLLQFDASRHSVRPCRRERSPSFFPELKRKIWSAPAHGHP
ncbi:hypothetical protein CFB50_31275 [Burkholderia sp. AU33423]|nr:hypothetical protein CFB50_31275 [Burkholderia sp. AU33423]